ncbi:unnamed protein product, partial [Owenia fusiformis]
AAFVELCKDLRAGFEQEAASSGQPRLLLTAAVGCGPRNIDVSYDVFGMSMYLDFINLMTYDLAGQWDGKTGIHGALHGGPGDTTGLNQEWSVNRYIELGAPRDKLVLGIPMYGRSFKLTTQSTAIGAPTATWGALVGPYTAEGGFLSYYEVCAKIKAGWTYVYDAQREDPCAYSGSNWVGYSDKYSVAKKAEFIIDKGLGGAMIWALDLDNFNKDSLCNTDTEDYTLLKTINNVLGGAVITTTTGPTTTTEAGASTTTQSAPTNEVFVCPSQGYRLYEDPNDCAKFITCLDGNNLGTQSCQQGLLFWEDKQWCDYPSNFECGASTGTSPSTPTTTQSAFTDEVFVCPNQDHRLYQDPNDCAKFITCLDGNNLGTQSCQVGLLFWEAKQWCDYPSNFNC